MPFLAFVIASRRREKNKKHDYIHLHFYEALVQRRGLIIVTHEDCLSHHSYLDLAQDYEDRWDCYQCRQGDARPGRTGNLDTERTIFGGLGNIRI